MKHKITFLLALGFLLTACKKDNDDADGKTCVDQGSALRVTTAPSGQLQTITANVTPEGILTWNPQLLMADGGCPLNSYTWTKGSSGDFPVSVNISNNGTVTWNNPPSGNTITKDYYSTSVEISDGTSTQTGQIGLIITRYSFNPTAVLQQVSGSFELVNGHPQKTYGASLFVTGGKPPYQFAIDDSFAAGSNLNLVGLTLGATSGVIHASKLNANVGDVIKFRARVTDSEGETCSGVYEIEITN